MFSLYACGLALFVQQNVDAGRALLANFGISTTIWRAGVNVFATIARFAEGFDRQRGPNSYPVDSFLSCGFRARAEFSRFLRVLWFSSDSFVSCGFLRVFSRTVLLFSSDSFVSCCFFARASVRASCSQRAKPPFPSAENPELLRPRKANLKSRIAMAETPFKEPRSCIPHPLQIVVEIWKFDHATCPLPASTFYPQRKRPVLLLVKKTTKFRISLYF